MARGRRARHPRRSVHRVVAGHAAQGPSAGVRERVVRGPPARHDRHAVPAAAGPAAAGDADAGPATVVRQRVPAGRLADAGVRAARVRSAELRPAAVRPAAVRDPRVRHAGLRRAGRRPRQPVLDRGATDGAAVGAGVRGPGAGVLRIVRERTAFARSSPAAAEPLDTASGPARSARAGDRRRPQLCRPSRRAGRPRAVGEAIAAARIGQRAGRPRRRRRPRLVRAIDRVPGLGRPRPADAGAGRRHQRGGRRGPRARARAAGSAGACDRDQPGGRRRRAGACLAAKQLAVRPGADVHDPVQAGRPSDRGGRVGRGGAGGQRADQRGRFAVVRARRVRRRTVRVRTVTRAAAAAASGPVRPAAAVQPERS